jgi:hypothetical protein
MANEYGVCTPSYSNCFTVRLVTTGKTLVQQKEEEERKRKEEEQKAIEEEANAVVVTLYGGRRYKFLGVITKVDGLKMNEYAHHVGRVQKMPLLKCYTYAMCFQNCSNFTQAIGGKSILMGKIC